MTVDEYISTRFSRSPISAEYYRNLWLQFSKMGLADSHFEMELTSGDEGKFWQRVFEMRMARRLSSNGHQISSRNEGPDFCLTHRNRKIKIEAIVPEPTGIPPEWLLPMGSNGNVRTVPFKEMLLRWTAAIKEKREKLDGRTLTDKRTGQSRHIPGYREKNIVAQDDVYVIAIDPVRLVSGPGLDEGTSRLPFALEAVFPVGPWAIPVLEPSGRLGRPTPTLRFSVKNSNDADVPTDSFLNQDYSGVSAVIGCATLGCEEIFPPRDDLKITIVHNPFATNPLPPGLFSDAAVEYVANKVGDGEYEITNLGSPS